jgi:hypothetical protein
VAQYVINNPYLLLNGASDMTANIKSCTLEVSVAEQDATDAASAGWTEQLGGLKSGSLKMEFYDDKAASNFDSIVWPLLGTVVAFQVNAAGSSTSTSNPKYTGSVLISGTSPLAGAVGDVAMVSTTWPTSGAVTRATS